MSKSFILKIYRLECPICGEEDFRGFGMPQPSVCSQCGHKTDDGQWLAEEYETVRITIGTYDTTITEM